MTRRTRPPSLPLGEAPLRAGEEHPGAREARVRGSRSRTETASPSPGGSAGLSPKGEAGNGLALLEKRIAEIPEALERTAAMGEPRLAPGLAGARGVVATGVGSSRAHARLLAHLLAEHAGLDAQFAPLGALAGMRPPLVARDRVLVLFSQGLSPNAWLALAHAPAWRRVIVVTAAGERTAGDRGERFRELAALGVDVVRFAGAEELGLLVRVVGPMCGMLATFGLARSLSAALDGGDVPAADVRAVIATIGDAVRRVPPLATEDLEGNLAFLASGGYGELTDNLRFKVLEGLLRPVPPTWDLLDFAHGAFQQAFAEPAMFLALRRRDAEEEPALVERLESMLDPARHRVVPLVATLPGPLALFEHEAQMNEILRREVAARGTDLEQWPGRGRDQPLYSLGQRDVATAEPLDRLTWPQVERAIAAGKTTVVVPLGAIEQHGPHLPLDTDARIARELAARLCRRFPDAIAAPVVAIGCSSEHGAFPGTLSLEAETLERLLGDLLRPLHAQGFRRAFVFSAHGGNVQALREMEPRLRAVAAPLAVVVFDELAELMPHLQAESARFGVSAEASGHHAGEFETSILLALAPGEVRTEEIREGLTEPTDDSQSLFYPSLRDRAPNGVVGDPRGADAARGERYLEAWVERLAEVYRR